MILWFTGVGARMPTHCCTHRNADQGLLCHLMVAAELQTPVTSNETWQSQWNLFGFPWLDDQCSEHIWQLQPSSITAFTMQWICVTPSVTQTIEIPKKKKKNPEKCCDSSFYISLLKILYLNNRNLTGDSPAVGFLPHTVLRLPVGKLFSKCNDITNVLLFFIDLGSQQTRVKSLKQCLCLQKYPDLLVLMENHCFPALWVPLCRLWCCSS